MKKVRTSIVIENELLQEIKHKAIDMNITQTEFIINCIKKELNKEK